MLVYLIFMSAYSSDLRERVVRAVELGEETREEIGERFGGGSPPPLAFESTPVPS